MKTVETRKHNRYTRQDKLVDAVMVVCVFAGIYGLLQAVGF
jgi:hypothetical protein